MFQVAKTTVIVTGHFGEGVKKSYLKADWMIGLLVMLTFLLLSETSFMHSLDGYAYDLGMRFSTDKPAHEDIVVVAIDDKSLQALGSWPWPREFIAQATNQLAKSRPKVIGYTMSFDHAQGKQALTQIEKLRQVLKKQRVLKRSVRKALESAEANLDSDLQLSSSLRTAGRIVLAMPYLSDPATAEIVELPDYLHKFSLTGKSVEAWRQLPLIEASSLLAPIEVLSKQVGGVGLVETRFNMMGHSRQQPLLIRYGERYLPSFALIMMARHKGLSTYHLNTDNGDLLRLDNQVVKTNASLSFYPRFYRSGEDKPAFKIYSFIDLLNGSIAVSELRRKTVIIGLTSSQHVAQVMTPGGEMMSPPLIQAHALSSLLKQESFHVPDWANLAQKAALVFIGLYLMLVLVRLRKTSGIFVSIFLLLIMANVYFILMSTESTWVPLIAPTLALIIGHIILGGRKLIDSHISGMQRALTGANRQLGFSYQAQGQLDLAFDKFKLCDSDESLLGQLYNLGLDYERKRQFNKAVSVFKYIQHEKKNYSDVVERIQQNQQVSEAVVLGGSAATNTNASLIIDKDGVQKPKLGRYQIDKEIGRGAMGMVYLGHDDKIGRTVAIKTMFLSEEIEADKRDAVKKRFFREAEAAGRLNHPNIVTVYDVGDEEDLAYIAMDYLKGKDLTAYCKKKKLLPLSTVFEIVMSVAEALDYAHQQHVVHRDIKPANIIYHQATGVAKLTDFGVACLTDASRTKTGTVLGSPYYMSPEQLAGKKVDGRSDLFSLGVTLYQMLAGDLPFSSDSMANLMYKITNEKHPDIRTFRPDVPSCVSTLINKTLHKDIGKRFQTGSQMAASMKRCYDKILEDE